MKSAKKENKSQHKSQDQSHVSQATLDARTERRARHAAKTGEPGNNPKGPRAEKPSNQGENFAIKAPKAIKVIQRKPADTE